MIRNLALVLSVGLCGCGPTEDVALRRSAVLEGTLGGGMTGDAWLFLYAAGEGPGAPAVPQYATAISRGRIASGDRRFVFPAVEPNPWRLWALLDLDGNFDPTIDVLAQPSAVDRVSAAVELQVQPGKRQTVDVVADQLVGTEPPSFRVEGEPLDVALDAQSALTAPLTLEADAVGRFDAQRVGFTLSLVDTNADGLPDDANGDGVLDVSLQFLLRWRPSPGQLEQGHEVVVPLAPDLTGVLTSLGGRLGSSVRVAALTLYVVPTAQETVPTPKGLEVRTFGSPPAGLYELVCLGQGGQFWRLPNQLGATRPSQSTRFHFDRTGP